VQRGDLHPFSAALARDLVVYADEVVAQLGELRSIAIVRPRRQPVLLDPPHPPNRVLVCTPAPRAGDPRRSRFRTVSEERALVESHRGMILDERKTKNAERRTNAEQ
jgi:hypothetical protein